MKYYINAIFSANILYTMHISVFTLACASTGYYCC